MRVPKGSLFSLYAFTAATPSPFGLMCVRSNPNEDNALLAGLKLADPGETFEVYYSNLRVSQSGDTLKLLIPLYGEWLS